MDFFRTSCFPRCAARARRRRRPPRPSRARVCEVARAAWRGPPWARRRGRRARWWSRARARRGWRRASRPRPPPRAQTGETCTARDGSGSSSARSRSGAATRGRLPNVEGPKSVSETAEARFVPCGSFARFRQNREEEIPGPPTAADAFVRGDGRTARTCGALEARRGRTLECDSPLGLAYVVHLAQRGPARRAAGGGGQRSSCRAQSRKRATARASERVREKGETGLGGVARTSARGRR